MLTMPDKLYHTVRARTDLPEGYQTHAAPESMDVFLQDWRAAYLRLGSQIEALEQMTEQRTAEKASGNWPEARYGS